MRRRDWAGTILVAALIALAGLLHSHVAGAIAFGCVAAVSLSVVTFDVGQERERRKAGSDSPEPPLEPEPRLSIETGNGWPWDDSRFAPAKTGADYLSSQETMKRSLDEILKSLSEPPNPDEVLDPLPVEGFSKKFLVTNDGPVTALGCRVQCVSTSSIYDLKWDRHGDELRINLVPGEINYAVFNFSGFREGVFQVVVRVFADNLDFPITFASTFEISRGNYPRVIDQVE
jgi:hypothetical protein